MRAPVPHQEHATRATLFPLCCGRTLANEGAPQGAPLNVGRHAASDQRPRGPTGPIVIRTSEELSPVAERAKNAKKKSKNTAIKCDLCAGLPFEACVYNCPCGAISRQNPEALKAIGSVTLNR